ncbi:AAA family ATPase [Candidatus Woesearchaeota archaeon]|nr:MAG: AAA family ATPase [Candidatus Woesearchaeota archaeon]
MFGGVKEEMVLEAIDQVEKFQEFFEINYVNDINKAISKGLRSINVDFFQLTKFDPDLAEVLLEEPEEVIKAAELAIEQFEIKKPLRVRFYNFPESQKIFIRNIRSDHLNKFIAIEGIIRQASNVRPEVVSARFECPSCGNIITMQQNENKFREPSRCSCGRRGKFRLLSKDLVDAQRLVIEENAQSLEGGAEPKRLSVFLREDLVEPRMEKKTTPGKSVVVTGILKEVPIPARDGGISTRFDIVMNANSIDTIEEDFSDVEVNEDDEAMIKQLAKDKNIYEKLRNSIAPSIYGHDLIKDAIALQLFGGVRKTKVDGTIIRGDIHVLLVGDPGAGKSAMLTFVKNTAPKARYVAGRSASGAGITATVVKDEFLRGWALEAGAIVLADKGVLVLDEMDKMSAEDTSALHEGMEQQTITIAKANIQATLRAQTTILAAANPKLGRFDPYAPLAQQIKLPPALINRFDLIFILRDLPDKEKDAKIAHHVLMHQAKMGNVAEIEPELLRKYIAYVKQRVFPVLTEEASETIKDFYVNIRNSSTNGDDPAIKPIPISARQLEAVVRLAEGSARIRLSDKVEKKDVLRAINLLKSCLMEIGVDPETGKIDIDRINTGITASERSKIVGVRDLIFKMDEAGKKLIAIDELYEEAAKRGIPEHKVDEAIAKLKSTGDIFEPKPNFIQKL